MYRASCRRRTRFSARIALDERKNKTPSLRMSETIPTTARAHCSMRSSCQSRPAFVGVGHQRARGANFCGPQRWNNGGVKRVVSSASLDSRRAERGEHRADEHTVARGCTRLTCVASWKMYCAELAADEQSIPLPYRPRRSAHTVKMKTACE